MAVRSELLYCTIAIIFCLTAYNKTSAAPATFVGLGGLSGGAFESFAADVSADGSVVVGNSNDLLFSRGFRWSAATGMVPLEGYANSFARAISPDGTAIVGDADFQYPLQWTDANGAAILEAHPDAISVAVLNISFDKQTIVGSHGFAGGPIATAWFNGSLMLLGTLDSQTSGIGSFAAAVSADGSVIVGGSGLNFEDSEAFRWTEREGMVGLGDLSGGSHHSEARDVSGDGTVVVGYSWSTEGQEAFIWTESTGMTGLRDFSGGNFHSQARAVSYNGTRIVGFGHSEQGSEAFLWTQVDGMLNLRDLLTANGATGLDGWQLTVATAISADGRTIVGNGINPLGQKEAWIANLGIPEPCGFLLASMAACLFSMKRLR